ncbi:MAG: hypothetical protein D3925_17500 [Candidatus Electrothrix sp. AR5]|nr:hypothetical protein [Candidatus Electrothrix sp. AR5]
MRWAWLRLHCICEKRGKKAEFYSDREKMQGKLAEFSQTIHNIVREKGLLVFFGVDRLYGRGYFNAEEVVTTTAILLPCPC